MSNNILSRETITALIVDDDKSQRLLMRKAVNHAGLQSTEVCNGLEAIESFHEALPDIILMDFNMPEMDGLTACKKMRQLPGGDAVPIIMVTGSDDYESIHMAYEAGATDFVPKPVNWTLLSYRVKYVLRAHRAIDELSVSEAKLLKACKIGNLGSWEWNLESNAFILSDELFQIFGMDKQTFGGTYAAFFGLIHPEDRNRIERELSDARRMRLPVNLEYRIATPDNSACYVRHEGNLLAQGQDRPMNAAGIIQDVTSRIQTEKQVKFLAFYDRLTELPNSFLYKELLGKAVANARRQKTSVAVMCITIVNFRRVTDTLGRGTGDEILKVVAHRIRNSVRDTDVAANLHEDPTAAHFAAGEFGLILGDLDDMTSAAVVARRVQAILSHEIEVEDRKIYLNSQIGISLCPSDGTSVETLMKNADIALSRSKEIGINTFQFYTADLNTRAFVRYSLEVDLRKAIEREELYCAYQPQVDLATGDIVGVEALLRWNHAEKGFISPLQIIEIAEETGLIMQIGELVLRAACRQNVSWQRTGYQNVRMSVNLSVAQLADKNLLHKIGQILAETGHPADLLELEITESMLMKDADAGMRIIEDLVAMGVHVSIDDFGTGYSSLGYLKRFPVRALKIDRSFVAGIPGSSDDNTIVTAIINLGHDLGLKIVAEGVETEEQREFLNTIHCDTIQGYLISKPVKPDEVVKFLKPGVPVMNR